MGRIKTKLSKRLSNDLLAFHRSKFDKDFETNKKVVGELLSGASKKVRNVVAGYVTRLMKTKENM